MRDAKERLGTRFCDHCGGEIGPDVWKLSRFCSEACRSKAWDEEMREWNNR